MCTVKERVEKKMNCKCGGLTLWLKNEIKYLEKMKESINSETNLYNILDAKILTYTIIFAGLNE